jgi:DNA-binding LacI/PurR family transcriptional regulator/DNA-binding transcriptional regulator YhcF (GntR family)
MQNNLTFQIDRKSVVSEVARVIADRIVEGSLSQTLPAERDLCELLGVSRSSLRLALKKLSKEGWIEIRHGKRCRILKKARVSVQKSTIDRKVLLVIYQNRGKASSHPTAFWIHDFRQVAAKQGWLAISEQVGRFHPETFESVMHGLREKFNPSVWILVGCQRDIHEAFLASGWPCLVCGTRFQGVPLPWIDTDNRASCRHAVGHLASLGHRRIGIVLPKTKQPGDDLSELGFNEGIESHCGSPLEPSYLRLELPKEIVYRDLRRAFNRQNPPTALIICRPHLTMTVVTVLGALGYRIPGDVSIICREYNGNLHDPIWPTLTTYCVDATSMSRKILGLARKLSKGMPIPNNENVLMPNFISGNSVRSASEKSKSRA